MRGGGILGLRLSGKIYACTHETDAQVVVAVARRPPVAVSRAAVGGIVPVAAATDDPVGARFDDRYANPINGSNSFLRIAVVSA